MKGSYGKQCWPGQKQIPGAGDNDLYLPGPEGRGGECYLVFGSCTCLAGGWYTMGSCGPRSQHQEAAEVLWMTLRRVGINNTKQK